MYVHFGQRPYGKCDEVPELFYVATWFFEIDFVPLIPLGTRLVLGKVGDQYHVLKIPFSFKSLFCAWSRAGFLIAAVVAVIFAIISYDSRHLDNDFATALVAALLFGAAFGLVMVFPRRASYARACELAQLANLNERGWAALNVLYGRDPLDRSGQPDVLRVQ